MNYQHQIDDTFKTWLTTKKCGDDISNAKILGRAQELVGEGFPCSVSLFHRSYLELLNEGEIQPFNEPFVPQYAPVHTPLTVEEYRLMPASEIAKKYMKNSKRSVSTSGRSVSGCGR